MGSQSAILMILLATTQPQIRDNHITKNFVINEPVIFRHCHSCSIACGNCSAIPLLLKPPCDSWRGL